MALHARNILIFHAGALGDFILTWPIALAAARLHPQSRVYFVTHVQKGALAEKVLRIDSSDIEAGWHALFSDDGDLPAAATTLLGRSHLIINLGVGDAAWEGRVRRLSPEVNIISLDPPNTQEFACHAADFLLEQLKLSPALQEAARQVLRSIAERGLPTSAISTATIAIHPGSGGTKKCWPAEKYLELITALHDRHEPVVTLLGEVELERWDAALIRKFEAASEVKKPSTYLQLLDVLTTASRFIGNDSGPAHLAGIIGTPSLVLFGPTDAVCWRPLGPRVRVIRRDPLEDLDVKEVLESFLTVSG